MRKIFSMLSIMKKIAPVLLVSIFLLPRSARSEITAGNDEVNLIASCNLFEKGHNWENRPVPDGCLDKSDTVSSSVPVNAVTAVPVDNKLTATFRGTMDPATITTGAKALAGRQHPTLKGRALALNASVTPVKTPIYVTAP